MLKIKETYKHRLAQRLLNTNARESAIRFCWQKSKQLFVVSFGQFPLWLLSVPHLDSLVFTEFFIALYYFWFVTEWKIKIGVSSLTGNYYSGVLLIYLTSKLSMIEYYININSIIWIHSTDFDRKSGEHWGKCQSLKTMRSRQQQLILSVNDTTIVE